MKIIQQNIPALKKIKLSAWRALSLGTWRVVGDSTVYGMLEVPVDRALAHLQELSQKSGERLTLTHFIGRAAGLTIKANPQINTLVRWGCIYQRKQVDLFFQIAADQRGDDLTGTVIRQIDQKSIVEIARELNLSVKTTRRDGDPNFKRVKGMVNLLPTALWRWILNALGFMLYSLNLWTPLIGAPRDPFGSAMISNVGSLDIEFALPPLVPYSRVPLILTIGSMKNGLRRAADGSVEDYKFVRLGVTFDHRLIDGVHAAKMAKNFREIFEQPDTLT